MRWTGVKAKNEGFFHYPYILVVVPINHVQVDVYISSSSKEGGCYLYYSFFLRYFCCLSILLKVALHIADWASTGRVANLLRGQLKL